MDLFLTKNYLLRCWGCIFLLNWIEAFTLSLLLKLPLRKMGFWFVLWSFFLLKSLCVSINLWGHVGIDASSCYLEITDKLQKWISKTVGPSLAASVKPVAHYGNVASLTLFYGYYFGRYLSQLAQLVPLPYYQGRSNCYPDWLHDFSVTIPRC